MGKSIIIQGADFYMSGIVPEGEFRIVKSAESVRAVKATNPASYGNNECCVYKHTIPSNYPGYTYFIPISMYAGREIQLKFKVGYADTIVANGGFLAALPTTFDPTSEGWTIASGYKAVQFISTVCTISSDEANTWVTKTYVVPQNAKYLIYTSKYDSSDNVAGIELVSNE